MTLPGNYRCRNLKKFSTRNEGGRVGRGVGPVKGGSERGGGAAIAGYAFEGGLREGGGSRGGV